MLKVFYKYLVNVLVIDISWLFLKIFQIAVTPLSLNLPDSEIYSSVENNIAFLCNVENNIAFLCNIEKKLLLLDQLTVSKSSFMTLKQVSLWLFY